MKRRNVESNKYRKQFHFRKCKFTEGMYGSAFLYIKFLLIWLLIMVADFLIEFRFEFLWPFWLFIRSIYDSFKYQGLIFSLFFALIAFLSDLFCYMFIPVQWLFFASSTYVWVQYVWHTEKGICLQTISLWLLFVYIEASVRLKSIKTIDLCRPFAAHCIGYPMVTLGFGFKSYLSYKWRLRKQKDVRKVNNFYMQLLHQALPLELQQQLQQMSNDEKYLKTIAANEDDLEQKSNNFSETQTQNINQPNNSLIQNLKEKCLSITTTNNPTQTTTATTTTNKTTVNGHHNTAALTITYPNEDLPYIQQKQETLSTTPTNTTTTSTATSTKYKTAANHQNGNISTTIGLAHLFNTNGITCDFVQNDQQSQQTQQTIVATRSSKNKSSSNHNFNTNSTTSTSFQTNNNTNTNKTQQPPLPPPTALCSSINASHTNININMTINATAIATATAQNTTTSNSTSQTSQTNKKYKNKDKLNQQQQHQQQQQQQQQNETTNGSNTNLVAFATATQTNTTSSTIATAAATSTSKDDYSLIQRLEEDLKKLQQELQQQKNVEQYLRNQINYLTKCDRTEKLKLEKLQQENEQLQSRLQKLNLQKQKDKDELQAVEKRLNEEKRLKSNLESQLSNERKSRETQEKLLNASSIKSNECSDYCKQKTREFEIETKTLAEQLNEKQDRLRSLEIEIKSLLKYRDTQNSLVSALNILEEKNFSLQDSLSEERRFKMDLLSALGETRRQLEAALIQLDTKDKELNALKCIFKTAINEHNHYLQTDLLAQLFTTISNPQYVNNYNNNSNNQQTNSINNTNNNINNNSNNNINNNNNNNNSSSSNMNGGRGSNCSTPQQLDPNVPIFTPNV